MAAFTVGLCLIPNLHFLKNQFNGQIQSLSPKIEWPYQHAHMYKNNVEGDREDNKMLNSQISRKLKHSRQNFLSQRLDNRKSQSRQNESSRLSESSNLTFKDLHY